MVVRAGLGLYRPGDGALFSFSLFLAPRVEMLSRNVDLGNELVLWRFAARAKKIPISRIADILELI